VTMLGVLEEQILVAVLRVRDGYGMEIRREIERVTGRDLSIGAVYATLDRLEAKGLVVSRRVQDVDGSRRVFELRAEGAQALAETHALRERLWAGVDLRRLRTLARA
jgi:PadR family transcriptional regulator, regulatory protein PadR